MAKKYVVCWTIPGLKTYCTETYMNYSEAKRLRDNMKKQAPKAKLKLKRIL